MPDIERLVRRLDDLQQRHRLLAQPVAVIRKYADDRSSALAGLLSYQVFLGMLPLLVVALTVFGRILSTSESLREDALDSAVAQFPVVGDRLREDVTALSVDGIWVWVTIAGLLWTATGIYNGFQLALNQVWNVAGIHRQGFVSRLLRALALFVLVALAAVGTGYLGRYTLPDTGVGWIDLAVELAASSVAASLLLLAVFRLVVAPEVATRLLVPAAAVAGVSWAALQALGQWIVLDRLSEAENLYGAIGFVIVTLFWINLLARAVVLANEVAVVHHRRLWPRRITQPPLNEADRRVLVGLLNNERRRPEQVITLCFDEDAEGPPIRREPSEDAAGRS